jgi:flagellar basal-body rod modification protein FlgD
MVTQPTNANPGVDSQAYIKALQQASNPSASAPSKPMGQADFLRLLSTQLQNQDPSKPMDPTSFVTDLTQMSQLQSTNSMNTSLTSMVKGFQSLQMLQGTSLIGKNIDAKGLVMSHAQGQNTNFNIDLSQPLKSVTVVLSDKNGAVKEMNLGDLPKGSKALSWDGLDNSGVASATGNYNITVYGKDTAGKIQSIDSIVPSKVSSVSVNTDGSMLLQLATGEKVSLSSVRQISG